MINQYNNKKRSTPNRIVHSNSIGFTYAMHGLVWAFKKQINLRIHTAAVFVVITAGFIVSLNAIEWLFIASAIFAVIVTELINTALEQATDAITNSFNIAIKRAKDVGAASVLISSIYALIVGILIFLPKLL